MSRLQTRTRLSSTDRTEKLVATGVFGGGCLFVFFWLLSALLSLAISGGILAALIAGAYYLCTGEFLFAS